MVESATMHCQTHGSTKFSKHKNGSVAPRFKCQKCAADAVQRVVEAKRERAYREFGNSCTVCGYDRCKTALEWHHTNPENKELTPSKVFSRSWDRIVAELKKCILLCANCHREIHAGLISI